MFDKSKVHAVFVVIVLLSLVLTGCLGGSGASPAAFRVQGVVNGGKYTGVITPKVILSEGATLISLKLNGENFESGTPLVEPGSYELEIVAKDKNGDIVTSKLSFTLAAHAFGGRTITVPGNYGTIQDAIDASSDGDIIVVSPGTYTENLLILDRDIKLTSVNPEDPKVVAATIIDGSQKDAVIMIRGSSRDENVVEVTGLTITNGIGRMRSGPGIRAGGGIYAAAAVVAISRNVITGNEADEGGGIFVNTSSLLPSRIEDNIIAGNTAKQIGGGLRILVGTGEIRNNDISNNVSQDHGGGLHLFRGNYKVESNTVSNNRTVAGNGAGILMANGNYTVTRNSIANNEAHGFWRMLDEYNVEIVGGNGAGMYIEDGHNIVEDNVICDNVCYNDGISSGGGVDLFRGEGSVMNNLVSGNLATYGGGISINQSIYLVSGNTIDKNTASIQGGGLNVYEGEQTISDNIVRSNLAQYGGGMSVSGQTTIMDNEVSDNTATLLGGGLYVDGASHTINGNIIRNNVVSQGSGGGLYVSAIRSNIFGNQVVGNFAGGEVPSDEAVYEITGGGGGFYVRGGSSVITNNEVSDNRTAGYGGGLHVLLGVHVVSDNNLTDNASGHDGGGLYCGHTTYPGALLTITRLTGNLFQGNSAQGKGGAVGVKAESSITDVVGNLLPIPDTYNDYIDNTPEDVYYQ